MSTQHKETTFLTTEQRTKLLEHALTNANKVIGAQADELQKIIFDLQGKLKDAADMHSFWKEENNSLRERLKESEARELALYRACEPFLMVVCPEPQCATDSDGVVEIDPRWIRKIQSALSPEAGNEVLEQLLKAKLVRNECIGDRKRYLAIVAVMAEHFPDLICGEEPKQIEALISSLKESEAREAAMRKTLASDILGKEPLHYLHEQFPGTVGHIPLQEYFENIKKAATPSVRSYTSIRRCACI